MITSCNSQTDLETLKYDDDISNIVLNLKKSEKRLDDNNGLKSYQTENLKIFKFGDIALSNYSIPNGYSYGTNNLYINVDNYDSNKYLGITLNISKEEDGKKILSYLKKNYDNPENRDTGGNGISLFWNDIKHNQWIFVFQNKENTRKSNIYLATRITIIKQGIRIENSSDPKVFTILDNFNMSYPKLK